MFLGMRVWKWWSWGTCEEKMMMQAIYHIYSGVVAISQGCAKLQYLALHVSYHQCCTCYGATGLFTPHRLPYCAWRKGQEFCRYALGWFITKGLCEPNMILPLPATRSTIRPGIGSYWRVWAQSQVVTLRYHRGECITSRMAKVLTQNQKNLSCRHLLEKMGLLHHCYQPPSALGFQTCCNQPQRILIPISWQCQKITVQ